MKLRASYMILTWVLPVMLATSVVFAQRGRGGGPPAGPRPSGPPSQSTSAGRPDTGGHERTARPELSNRGDAGAQLASH